MENQKLIHNLHTTVYKKSGFSYKIFFIGVSIFVILGILIGFGLAQFKTTTSGGGGLLNGGSSKTIGTVDKTKFKDSAEGLLKEGGIDGEGNYHLERTGGISQNVYLTSSTVDLSQYIGKKIKVWGETFKGQKAGWLMDVGFIELK